MSELTRVALSTGIELDVWDTGPRDGEALVFLHGFPENHRTWRHQIAHFSDRYRCIAPDQRGYGNSSRPEEVEAYGAERLCRDIFALAAALGIESFTVVGHDWGGALAWPIAMFGQADGMVTRAIIANAPHGAVFQPLLWTDPAQRMASQYFNSFRDPANDALVREHGLGALLLQALTWDRRPNYPPAEQALLLEQWADPARAFAMLNWYRASGVDVPAPQAPLAVPDGARMPVLPKVEIPTLVIWGMQDEALLPANLELKEHVSDLTIVRLLDVGHFVPWEAPGAVNAAMEEFLAR